MEIDPVNNPDINAMIKTIDDALKATEGTIKTLVERIGTPVDQIEMSESFKILQRNVNDLMSQHQQVFFQFGQNSPAERQALLNLRRAELNRTNAWIREMKDKTMNENNGGGGGGGGGGPPRSNGGKGANKARKRKTRRNRRTRKR